MAPSNFLAESNGSLLDIEDGVLRVHGSLVLGGFTDQTLLLGEGNEGRGGKATLLVGNDLNIGTLVDGNARVGRAWKVAKIETVSKNPAAKMRPPQRKVGALR